MSPVSAVGPYGSFWNKPIPPWTISAVLNAMRRLLPLMYFFKGHI